MKTGKLLRDFVILTAILPATFISPVSADPPVPIVVNSIGGGGFGQPVVMTGIWDFDDLAPDQRGSPVNCENTVFSPFGGLPATMGWQPSPESNVQPRIEPLEGWLEMPSLDVGGWALVFYEPNQNGFVPFQRSIMESPPFPVQDMGSPSATWEIVFATNCNNTFPMQQLALVVGSRFLRQGVWSEWIDQSYPIPSGPNEHRYLLNIAADAQAGQARVGVKNENGTPTPDPGPAVDKVKAEAKAPATISTWKYVPDISQGDGAICQASAFANCLSYWANNGYSELAPAQGTQEEKNKKIQEDLKKEVHDNDKGDGGVTKYMKDKGVMKGQQQPNGRRPLEHKRMSSQLALWDSLLANFQKCHDVLLRVTWCDEDGNPVDDDAAHYMTVAGITVDENGNKKIHVSNPWGDSHHSPTEDTRDDAYDELDVTVGQDGKVRLDNDEIEDNAAGIDDADHLCLTHINVIRPVPAGGAPKNVTLTMMGGERSLVTYGYGILNDFDLPVNEWAMYLDVPYQDVESPPGWNWEPLPADYQNAMGCGDRLEPGGILWTTTTTPVPPGGYLSGFQFKVDSQFPSEDFGVIWWTDTAGGLGEYGPVGGPVRYLSAAVDPMVAGGGSQLQLLAYPNPSSGTVRLRFAMGAPGAVRMEVFDIGGRLIRRIAAGEYPAGGHDFAWDGTDEHGRRIAAGAYEVRVRLDGQDLRRRLVLLD